MQNGTQMTPKMASKKSILFGFLIVQFVISALVARYAGILFPIHREIVASSRLMNFTAITNHAIINTVTSLYNEKKAALKTLIFTNTTQQITAHISSYTPPLKVIGLEYFPNLIEKFQVPKYNSRKVPRAISQEEYDTLMDLVDKVTRVLTEHNITYVLTYGSLMGSYLMHDMLPWDDDVDIYVHNDTKAKVMEIFKSGKHYGISGHHHYKHPGYLFKVFFLKSNHAGKYPWRWPFIDLVSYIHVGKNIKAVERHVNLQVPKSTFYPFHVRPFGPLWLNVPKEPSVFLAAKYKQFRCMSGRWDHKHETGGLSKQGKCRDINAYYPFVKRNHWGTITKETLLINGTEIYDVFINASYKEQHSIYEW